MRRLQFRNRQKSRAVNRPLLRDITLSLLDDLLQQRSFELNFYFLAAPQMAEMNEQYLQHSGSTDVITFDYIDESKEHLFGEIFISVDDAILQAKEFRTSWQSELVRYIVHGILHLRGFDDLEPVARKKMKREENRLVKALAQRFPIHLLAEK